MGKQKKKFGNNRYEEIRRAQERAMQESSTIAVPKAPAVKNLKKIEYPLPEEEIKKDLIKNVGYVAFSLLVLAVLYKTQFGYVYLAKILGY